MSRSIYFPAAIFFLAALIAPGLAAAAETCPLSPAPTTPSWCTLGIGGQFTAVVRQGEKTDASLPANYRICMAKPNEPTTPDYATTVYYGNSPNASSPLPQSITLHTGECFCAANTAGLQIASQTQAVVGGSMELLPSGTFTANGACKAPDAKARTAADVTLSPPELVSAECISFYGGTPYHQGRCEILNRSKLGNYRLCFPSDFSFPSGHVPGQFAGNAVKLFVNARYMETNEGQYDARRSSITTTCIDVFDARTVQATVFEPQPGGDALPPPMHNPVDFQYYWKSDDVKRIKVLVQRIVTR
jgi:hypothetical protein